MIHHIIPCPLKYIQAEGEFDVSRGNTSFSIDNNLEKEEYHISVSPSNCKITAGSENGYILAKQTLKQITSADQQHIPCCQIEDAPRFSYRGLLLDCARHFFPKDEIKKVLRIMAFYKLNYFHWHLTDDHAWRVEIKKYPQLTAIGAFGNVGSHPDNTDDNLVGQERYEGFYSQNDIIEIVEYATSLGITIIPEIDMPGHITPVLAAFPHLGCTGGPYEVIHTVAPRSKGLAKDNLCIGNEEIFQFVADIFDEILQLFPSDYIHIGGDECQHEVWDSCPKCNQLLKNLPTAESYALTPHHRLQNYFTQRLQNYLQKKGRRIIGWEEILNGILGEGATIMSWRGIDMGIQATQRHIETIMTPTQHCYFDFRQYTNSSKEPYAFGKFPVTVKDVYSLEPAEGLSSEETNYIKGVQANLWTDIISTTEYLEYMLLPRLAALSEVQWCNPGKKDWNRFLSSLHQHTHYYEQENYVYAKHLWGKGGLPGKEYDLEQQSC